MTAVVVLVALGVVVAAIGLWLRVELHLPPGGYVVFGVAAALVLVALAKILAALGLQRPAAPDRDDD
jgi:hypothetical protein